MIDYRPPRPKTVLPPMVVGSQHGDFMGVVHTIDYGGGVRIYRPGAAVVLSRDTIDVPVQEESPTHLFWEAAREAERIAVDAHTHIPEAK